MTTFAEAIVDELTVILDSELVNPIDVTKPFYFVLGQPSDITPVRGVKEQATIRISVLGDDATGDLSTEQAQKVYILEIACLIKNPKKVAFNKERIAKLEQDFWVIDIITQIVTILRVNELLNSIELYTEKIETIICSNADYIPELLSDALYSSGRVTATITTSQVKPERRA